MRNMKRPAALLTGIIVSLSLVACSSSKPSEAELKKAIAQQLEKQIETDQKDLITEFGKEKVKAAVQDSANCFVDRIYKQTDTKVLVQLQKDANKIPANTKNIKDLNSAMTECVTEATKKHFVR